MEEELIAFRTAELAKLAGFREPVVYYFQTNPEELGEGLYNELGFLKDGIGDYNDFDAPGTGVFHCSRPTQDLLQRWLREKHGLTIQISYSAQPGHLGYVAHIVSLTEVRPPSPYDGSFVSPLTELVCHVPRKDYDLVREEALALALDQVLAKQAAAAAAAPTASAA